MSAEHAEKYEIVLSATLTRVLDLLKFAEAKNAAILAFSSAWIVGIINLLTGSKSLLPGYFTALTISLPLFIISSICALISLLPKTNLSAFTGRAPFREPNLLFFGDIQKLKIDDFKTRIDFRYNAKQIQTSSDHYVNDLAVQIHVNSVITQRKYNIFYSAAILALGAIAIIIIPALLGLFFKIWISIS